MNLIASNMSFYLAVDRNGDENVFIEKPKRFQITSLYSFTRFLWGTSNSKLEHDEFTDSGKFKLPKGFIKRLIGKELTWVDDSVEFKTINMENNQITIDVPNGMMIDVKNSDLSKGIIKFIEKPIAFIEVVKALQDSSKYIDSLTYTRVSCTGDYMIAFARLQDIAQYYNKGWKYVPCVDSIKGYHIVYDSSIDEQFSTRPLRSSCDVYAGQIVFKNEEDAQAVIDNPNFRDILDKVYRV